MANVCYLVVYRHATKVRGLEAYGIDPAVLGRQVQKRYACSTSSQPAPVRDKSLILALCGKDIMHNRGYLGMYIEFMYQCPDAEGGKY